jgi:hypothetical protein
MILKNANQLLVINSNWYNKYINYDTRQEDSETLFPGNCFLQFNELRTIIKRIILEKQEEKNCLL